MKRALIFDFGGVLMKTVDYTPRHNWDVRLGLPRGTVEQIVHGAESWRKAQRGEITPAAYWADVAAQLNITTKQAAQLAVDFYSGDQLDADLIGLIRELRAGGHTVALLSNDSPELRAKLQKLGIIDLFDPLVISAEIGVMKPDAAAFEIMLERLTCPAEETIFIDDLPANVDAAAAIGIHSIQYINGMNLREMLVPLLRT